MSLQVFERLGPVSFLAIAFCACFMALMIFILLRSAERSETGEWKRKDEHKAGVHMNRSEIWSDIKTELLGLKSVRNTTRQLTPSIPLPKKKESPRL